MALSELRPAAELAGVWQSMSEIVDLDGADQSSNILEYSTCLISGHVINYVRTVYKRWYSLTLGSAPPSIMARYLPVVALALAFAQVTLTLLHHELILVSDLIQIIWEFIVTTQN